MLGKTTAGTAVSTDVPSATVASMVLSFTVSPRWRSGTSGAPRRRRDDLRTLGAAATLTQRQSISQDEFKPTLHQLI
ncbi:hypothetical protein GCM10020229_03380 [Kitasatospora albolonga]